MQYEVFGGSLPAVTIGLEPGESIFTQAGGMSWMSDGIQMQTNTHGGVRKGLMRMLTGESLFMATYTATKPGDQITLSSSFPGSILVLDVGEKEYISQKAAFLGAQPRVEVSVELNRSVSGGLFGGEGFLLQRLHGEGKVFLEIDGSCKMVELQAGQRLIVSTGNVAVFESSVGYSVETVKGFKNIFFGGEGVFWTVLEGPGRVWLQTMTASSLAGRLMPYMPTDTKD